MGWMPKRYGGTTLTRPAGWAVDITDGEIFAEVARWKICRPIDG